MSIMEGRYFGLFYRPFSLVTSWFPIKNFSESSHWLISELFLRHGHPVISLGQAIDVDLSAVITRGEEEPDQVLALPVLQPPFAEKLHPESYPYVPPYVAREERAAFV